MHLKVQRIDDDYNFEDVGEQRIGRWNEQYIAGI
jgi:hypothetical protein